MEKSNVDMLWVIVSTCLVFLMQAGFLCLETGFTRSKNNINVAMKNMADFSISALLFWLVGFGLMFGVSGLGWVGTSNFMPSFGYQQVWLAIFFLFQMMFCAAAVTILSGAAAERLRFSGYLIISAFVAGIIYPFFGHWVWNGLQNGASTGWLGALGFVDFAGGSVVHSVGGWVSLATILVLGPRLGRFPEDGEPQKIASANIPLAALGALLLYLGWFGFNGGSTLALNELVPQIIINTVLAGATGMITGLLVSWRTQGEPKVDLVMNGSLAGLVSITASAHAVTSLSAITIGAVGALLMMVTEEVLERFKIDDSVGAVPVHLTGGLWGTLAVGIFGQAALLNTGLPWVNQIGVQLIGMLVCAVWVFGFTYLFLRLLNQYFPLRVTAEDEQIGLNVSEHGASTELLDFFQVMVQQSQTGDVSLRVAADPFSEVGQIAAGYNRVMAKLEETERAREVFDRAIGMVTFSQQDLSIRLMNPAAETIFGYESALITNQPINNLLKTTGETSLSHLITEAARTDQSLEIMAQRADGSTFPVEVTIGEVRIDQELLYVATCRDITKRKESASDIQVSPSTQKITSPSVANNDLVVTMAEQRQINELDVTRQLQQLLMPTLAELRQIKQLDLGGLLIQNAKQIATDLHDMLLQHNNVQLGIVDNQYTLTGGVLILMTGNVIRSLLTSDEQQQTLLLNTLNHTINHHMQRPNQKLSLAVLDLRSDDKPASATEHEQIMIVHQNGKVAFVNPYDLGSPIGINTTLVGHLHFHFQPIAGVVLFSSGMRETSTNTDSYGLEKIQPVVQRYWHESANAIAAEVMTDMSQIKRTSKQSVPDDLTLLVLKQK